MSEEKKVCGYCGTVLPTDKICRISNCMYKGAKQLNPNRKEVA